MKSPATVSLLILAAAIMPCACNTSGCLDNRSSLPLAGFYSSSSGGSIFLDSLDIGGIGAPNDSLLLACPTAASEVYLPLRATAQNASFLVEYRYRELDGIRDRIDFGYESFAWFASEECGAMYRYRITSLTYTRNLIDSIAVIPADSIITNSPEQNLKIYFRAE